MNRRELLQQIGFSIASASLISGAVSAASGSISPLIRTGDLDTVSRIITTEMLVDRYNLQVLPAFMNTEAVDKTHKWCVVMTPRFATTAVTNPTDIDTLVQRELQLQLWQAYNNVMCTVADTCDAAPGFYTALTAFTLVTVADSVLQKPNPVSFYGFVHLGSAV